MSVNNVNGNFFTYQIKRGDNLTKIAKANDTTIGEILKLNPQIKKQDLIYASANLILADNRPFVQRQDYDPKKLNIGNVSINGETVDVKLKSNFFANQNLDKIANSGAKLVITLQGGKESNKNDLNAYSVLNKILSNHLNNSSEIIDDNGKKRPQNQEEAFKNTDIYIAFISNDVNGDNFNEFGELISRGKSGNNVQFPTVCADENGQTYFVLHSKDGLLYFDSTGAKTDLKDNKIVSSVKNNESKTPIIDKTIAKPIEKPNSEEFLIPEQYNENQLNLGIVFINGKPVDVKTNANFYRTEINNYATETINDKGSSRLDVQLKAGNTMNPKYNDDSADSILKKLLGNNCDKISLYQNKSNNDALALLRNTDLFKAFVSEDVNGNNFENGKLKVQENGFNTVQLPALEVDKNGTMYYVLHTNNGVLYFDDKGNKI